MPTIVAAMFAVEVKGKNFADRETNNLELTWLGKEPFDGYN